MSRPTSPPEPTDRQATALHFIRGMIALRGYPPTNREIGRHMGIKSTNATNDHIKALERKGFLERDYMHARGMRLTPLAKQWLKGEAE